MSDDTLVAGGGGCLAAAAIFWPVDRVSSAIFTRDARPQDVLSTRLEYRRDSGSGPLMTAWF